MAEIRRLKKRDEFRGMLWQNLEGSLRWN